jgi:hypothetical protein
VEFTSATNGMSLAADKDCSDVLDVAVISSLGSGATCEFRTPLVLTVLLGSGATILVGDTLAVKANTISSHNGVSSSVVVMAPRFLIAPVFSINGLSPGACVRGRKIVAWRLREREEG